MRHKPHTCQTHRLARICLALLLGCIVFCLGGCSTVTVGEEEPERPVEQIVPSAVAIVHTAAIDGHYARTQDCLGGAAISGLAQDLAEEGYEVLLLDSGNSIGQIDGNDITDGESAVGFLNAMGYDALAVGKSELALGNSVLARRSSQSDFPLLSANVQADDILEASTTYTLKDGRMVGVFGLASPSEASQLSPIATKGMTVSNEYLADTASAQAKSLRERGCRLVICLANLDSGDPSATELAMRSEGVDVMLASGATSESKTVTNVADGRVLVVETPPALTEASVVTWKSGSLSSRNVDRASAKSIDDQVDALVTQTAEETAQTMTKVLTSSTDGLPVEGIREGETALGDLVADAVLWKASKGLQQAPDAAIVDAGSIVAGLPKGDVTRQAAWDVCPHVTTRLCLVQVTGAQLLGALAGALPQRTQASEDTPQVAGIMLTMQEEEGDEPPSLAIASVGSKEFSPQASYTLVMTQSALTRPGAYRALLQKGYANVEPLEDSAAKAVASYIARECKGSIPERYDHPQNRMELKERPHPDDAPEDEGHDAPPEDEHPRESQGEHE